MDRSIQAVVGAKLQNRSPGKARRNRQWICIEVASFHHTHRVSFMFFDLHNDSTYIDWLLILFLSVSFISIPVLINSWIRYYFKDDLM